MTRRSPWLAGLDGCRTGWIAAFVRPWGDEVCVRIARHFADVVVAPEERLLVAQKTLRIGGRRAAAELCVRAHGPRGRCNRAGIYAADFGSACAAAIEGSTPPRKVSKQLFMIAPKIREVDTALRTDTSSSANGAE
jgi:predicted RNase H-like nuclease